MVNIVGILNITSDSFSDGGLFLELVDAVEKARSLITEGANWLDIGAEASNPEGEKISARKEIERLAVILKVLKPEKFRISIDTYKPEVIKYVLQHGAKMINDITGLKNPESIEILSGSKVPVVIMFARNKKPHAEKTTRSYTTLLDEIKSFFEERLNTLSKAGIKIDRIILDPGMGFFLGGTPEPSLKVLKNLKELKKCFNRPLFISTSRKSFIGSVLNRPVQERNYGTLATEIWAYLQGVDYIRTHDVKPLNDAVKMLQAIQDIK